MIRMSSSDSVVKDMVDEAGDWIRFGRHASLMLECPPDWQISDDETIYEGSIYSKVYPLLLEVIDEADRLAGWKLRQGGWGEGDSDA